MKKEELKKYLEKEMSDREKNALEKQLADDPFFAEGVEGLQQWKADTGKPFDELDAELEKQLNESLPDRTARIIRMPWLRLILVAASLAGLGFFSLHYFYQERTKSEKLFLTNFKPLSHPDMTVRGENSAGNADESFAVRSYETENYKQAIIHYKKLAEQYPGEEKYALFLGISYLANYQPELAVEILNKDFPAGSGYENDRNWYLALSYLRLNNPEAAKIILSGLNKGRSYYTELAGTILKELP